MKVKILLRANFYKSGAVWAYSEIFKLHLEICYTIMRQKNPKFECPKHNGQVMTNLRFLNNGKKNGKKMKMFDFSHFIDLNLSVSQIIGLSLISN